MREKKNKFLKQIREKVEAGEEIDNDETTDIATKWMEIADVDGNGTIDEEEFKDLISKLDDNLEESKVCEIFSSSDAEGNG